VIRQAISCDICATEKRQTNHWFVAYEQAGELRVSGWSSRHKLRPGSKHLCGQTCLHKLVDEFMAKSIAVRTQRPANEAVEEVDPELPAVSQPGHEVSGYGLSRAANSNGAPVSGPAVPAASKPPAVRDASLTSSAAYPEPDSSARLIVPPAIVPQAVTPPAPVLPRPAYRPQPELVTTPPRPHLANPIAHLEESPRYASRNWRAEAWERERERELRAIGNRPGIAARRASNA
jgi:hypothetical protein